VFVFCYHYHHHYIPEDIVNIFNSEYHYIPDDIVNLFNSEYLYIPEDIVNILCVVVSWVPRDCRGVASGRYDVDIVRSMTTGSCITSTHSCERKRMLQSENPANLSTQKMNISGDRRFRSKQTPHKYRTIQDIYSCVHHI